jgi:hypothetical protein
VDHGGQTEHQEGAREPRRHAREGGEPIQFGIAEFKSNSESMTLVSCSSKIGVVRNYQNSTDLQNRFWCCTTILARWVVCPVGVH